MRSFGFGVFMLVLGIVLLGLNLVRQFERPADFLFHMVIAVAFIVSGVNTFYNLTKQR